MPIQVRMPLHVAADLERDHQQRAHQAEDRARGAEGRAVGLGASQ